MVSAGPNLAQARAHLVDGAMNSPTVTLELAPPRGAKAVRVHAATRVGSGAPPRPSKYNIDYSTDGGKTWKGVLTDWQVVRRKPEPNDWWSQTFPFGDAPLADVSGPVRVRFTNTGRRPTMRAEAHLLYRVKNTSPLRATFAWSEGGQEKRASHVYANSTPHKADASWGFDAGAKPETIWVQYAAE